MITAHLHLLHGDKFIDAAVAVLNGIPSQTATRKNERGPQPGKRYRRWTPKEDALLRAGKTVPNRGKNAQAVRRRKLGLPSAKPRRFWTPGEYALVITGNCPIDRPLLSCRQVASKLRKLGYTIETPLHPAHNRRGEKRGGRAQ